MNRLEEQMNDIIVWQTIDNGFVLGFDKEIKRFGEHELQNAIDFIKDQDNPPHWYQVSQDECITMSGDELLYDREVYGEIYHDLSGY